MLLGWLEELGWEIIGFDFPQSGTGIVLHPDQSARLTGTKNNGAIIPDIIARKNGRVLFFENKDRFVAADFEKMSSLKNSGSHSQAIHRLTGPEMTCFFGIGLPLIATLPVGLPLHLANVDFVVGLDASAKPFAHYDPAGLFTA